jgi:5-keto 4-deoxyuronate isomerase
MFIEEAKVHTYQNSKKFKHSEVRFVSLGDKLGKTGRTINQFVQTSAPAEGYA